jgi:hypothetical protein
LHVGANVASIEPADQTPSSTEKESARAGESATPQVNRECGPEPVLTPNHQRILPSYVTFEAKKRAANRKKGVTTGQVMTPKVRGLWPRTVGGQSGPSGHGTVVVVPFSIGNRKMWLTQ